MLKNALFVKSFKDLNKSVPREDLNKQEEILSVSQSNFHFKDNQFYKIPLRNNLNNQNLLQHEIRNGLKMYNGLEPIQFIPKSLFPNVKSVNRSYFLNRRIADTS